MTKLSLLGAPYSYVHTERVVSDVVELLQLDQPPTGTSSTSIIIAREKSGISSLMKLKGLGKYLWNGLDAQEYINKLRDEWEE